MKRIRLVTAADKSQPFDVEGFPPHPALVEFGGKLFVLQTVPGPDQPAVRTYLEAVPYELTQEQMGDVPLDDNGLRTDGPTLEEYTARGFAAASYPPRGYAAKGDPIPADEAAAKVEPVKGAAGDPPPPAPAPVKTDDATADWLGEQITAAKVATTDQLGVLDIAVEERLDNEKRADLLTIWIAAFDARTEELAKAS